MTPLEIIDQLKQPLAKERVQKRPGAGNKSLSYLETHDVIDRLNAIFGFDGWECQTSQIKACPADGSPVVGFIAIVSLSVHFGEAVIERHGTGWGTVAKGNYELGAKEAESDALKRAARTLRDQFGNCLYEKDAPEHQGIERARLATTAQLQECEALRQRAVQLGFRVKGNEPKKTEDGAEESKVLAKIDAFRKYIQEHGDKGAPSTTRFDALQNDMGGLSRFLNACAAASLAFETDADIEAFENAATPKAGIAIVVEDLSDDDWHGWAAMVEGGTLSWGVSS